jgi:transcription antitermination protein NusB
MSRRRTARKCALQVLYVLDMGKEALTVESVSAAFTHYWQSFPHEAEVQQFAEEVVRGIAGALDALDAELRGSSSHWRLERMSPIDRNILRLGLYELQYTDTPAAIVINESIELAKLFGEQQSPAFVNGVLDELRRKHAHE